MSNIELQINELILAGFAPADRGRIAAALIDELNRLFAEHGIPEPLLAGGAVDALDGGAFRLTPGARPEWIGRRIAETLYRQWSAHE